MASLQKLTEHCQFGTGWEDALKDPTRMWNKRHGRRQGGGGGGLLLRIWLILIRWINYLLCYQKGPRRHQQCQKLRSQGF